MQMRPHQLPCQGLLANRDAIANSIGIAEFFVVDDFSRAFDYFWQIQRARRLSFFRWQYYLASALAFTSSLIQILRPD